MDNVPSVWSANGVCVLWIVVSIGVALLAYITYAVVYRRMAAEVLDQIRGEETSLFRLRYVRMNCEIQARHARKQAKRNPHQRIEYEEMATRLKTLIEELNHTIYQLESDINARRPEQ